MTFPVSTFLLGLFFRTSLRSQVFNIPSFENSENPETSLKTKTKTFGVFFSSRGDKNSFEKFSELAASCQVSL